MGMYDSLYTFCPKCGAELEFQSKSGPGLFEIFAARNLPMQVATGMDQDVVLCTHCDSRIKFVLKEKDYRVPAKFNLIVVKQNSFDYKGNFK